MRPYTVIVTTRTAMRIEADTPEGAVYMARHCAERAAKSANAADDVTVTGAVIAKEATQAWCFGSPEFEAVRAFARMHGRTWKSKL